ncbi:hypothetical protein [Undibacterium sp. Xuan67W]
MSIPVSDSLDWNAQQLNKERSLNTALFAFDAAEIEEVPVTML